MSKRRLIARPCQFDLFCFFDHTCAPLCPGRLQALTITTTYYTTEGCTSSDSFIAAAHQFSHGVARQLNRVCLNGLLIGFAECKMILEENDAKRAILELDRAL